MKRSGSLERAAATEETCDAENAIWPVSIRADHPALDATLDYICSHENVWKATGSEIVQHYLSSNPSV